MAWSPGSRPWTGSSRCGSRSRWRPGWCSGRSYRASTTALDHLRVGTVSLPIAVGLALDDVSGTREGPLRGPGPCAARRRERPRVLRGVAVPVVGRGSGAHVRARLAVPGRRARLPDRGHHRGPGSLHRDGPGLERHRARRPGSGGDPRRVQRDLPGRRVLPARLLLPDRPARMAGLRHAGVRGGDLGGRPHRADLPRDPAHGRLPHPADPGAATRAGMVRGPLHPADQPDHPVRPAVHDRRCCSPSRARRSPRSRSTSRRIALPLLAYFAIMWVAGFGAGR